MFGIHIKKHFELGNFHTLEDAVESIVSKYNLNTCQVFLYGPQNRRKNDYDEKSLLGLSEKTNIYVHSTYLTDNYWTAVEENNESKLHNAYKHIQDQLSATNNINGKGFVIHITRKPISVIVQGMELLEKNINQGSTKIILEFKAMKSSDNCSYEKIEKLNTLNKALSHIKLDWGFCIDTSHMWSTGVKMQDYDFIKNWFENIKDNKIILIHLNAASNDTFGTGKDVHQVPFSKDDDIWGDLAKSIKKNNYDFIKLSSFGYILSWAKKNKIPIIGEFNRGSNKEFIAAIIHIQKILECINK